MDMLKKYPNVQVRWYSVIGAYSAGHLSEGQACKLLPDRCTRIGFARCGISVMRLTFRFSSSNGASGPTR